MAGARLRFELRELALVAAGAVPGALLRWQAVVRLGPLLGQGAAGPAAAHLLVNLLGSFLLGVLAGPVPWRTTLVLFGGIGFCGSFTTFSSWMLDLERLARSEAPAAALTNLGLSLGLGVMAAAAGLGLCRRIRRPVPPRSPR